MWGVQHGDSLQLAKQLPGVSIDAIVTDPPYGIGFMGKGWDHKVPGPEFWAEFLRIAKPGTHLLAMGGTRTFHRLMVAIEDAGWEIRDTLSWMYGQGFPKSLDVSKAIDRALGLERETGPVDPSRAGRLVNQKGEYTTAAGWSAGNRSVTIDPPASDAARQWDGWGTALKPAWEPIVLARKPLNHNVAANVLEHGTGAMNVDGCRIGSRWPANVALDEEAAAALDAQSGMLKSGAPGRRRKPHETTAMSGTLGLRDRAEVGYADSGGASRFFYCAKARTSEREAGLTPEPGEKRANKHPTVKPLDLMRWMVRLVTPPGGIVLDPFCGSGSTGCAAVLEGARFIGIEKDADSVQTARQRIAHWATLI